MTPLRLALFRLGLLILGPAPWGSRLVRRALLALVRKDGRITYAAHAGFLDVRDLRPDRTARPLTQPETLHG